MYYSICENVKLTHLAHSAQGVGLLACSGLVSPGDGGVHHSVGPRHHLELLSLTHLQTTGTGHQSLALNLFCLFLLTFTTAHFDLGRGDQGQGPPHVTSRGAEKLKVLSSLRFRQFVVAVTAFEFSEINECV